MILRILKIILLTGLAVVSLLVVGLFVLFPIDKEAPPYSSRFNDTDITFPITVGEAMKKYNVKPHQYNKMNVDTFIMPPKMDSATKVCDVFYVRSATDYGHSPADSSQRNVYAIRFCFTKDDNFEKIKTQLEKQYKSQFIRKKAYATDEFYLQLKIADYMSVVIDFYPENSYNVGRLSPKKPEYWTVSYCYNLYDRAIDFYVFYGRTYDAQ